MTMRSYILVLALGIAACAQQNPDLCCVDQADCAANNITNPKECSAGLVCRGNQCIAETCQSSSQCESLAPYCVNESCTTACDADAECPGASQAASDVFCEAGACVECRANMDDCNGVTPICDSGACRACATNADCTSGVCESDGHCVATDEIAYVSTTGSTTTDCSKTNPCTLTVGVAKPLRYVVLASGTYTLSASLQLGDTKKLIGDGTHPKLTSNFVGSIVTVPNGGDVTLQGLVIAGATSNPAVPKYGYGVECPTSTFVATLHIYDSALSQNSAGGLQAQSCIVDAKRSDFSNNMGDGFVVQTSLVTIDRCSFTGNVGEGVDLDSVQQSTVTNSFITRNSSYGLYLSSGAGVTSTLEFNTIADNNSGMRLDVDGSKLSAINNLILRNPVNTMFCTPSCDFTASIITADPTPLRLKSPDISPYDYHLTHGSSAIDAAVGGTEMWDYDGDVRPKGAARDVGADEAE